MNIMNFTLDQQIAVFWQSEEFAVIGASADRNKYGNKVLRCYMQHHKTVYPINPYTDFIEGLACYKNLSILPSKVKSISIVTMPKITESIMLQAINQGINNIWIQPGADSANCPVIAKDNQINLIYGGPCILVATGFKDI